MAPKSKKGNSTPPKKKRQTRPRPKEPETATEEVESSTPEPPPQGSKNRQSKKMSIEVTALEQHNQSITMCRIHVASSTS